MDGDRDLRRRHRCCCCNGTRTKSIRFNPTGRFGPLSAGNFRENPRCFPTNREKGKCNRERDCAGRKNEQVRNDGRIKENSPGNINNFSVGFVKSKGTFTTEATRGKENKENLENSRSLVAGVDARDFDRQRGLLVPLRRRSGTPERGLSSINHGNPGGSPKEKNFSRENLIRNSPGNFPVTH